jgi:uncharacterized protein (DUF885 family)
MASNGKKGAKKMRDGIARFCLSAALLATTCLSTTVQAAANNPSIARSNAYTQRVLDVVFKHAPEWASEQGLSQFDPLIANPTLAEQMTKRRELEAVVADLKAAQSKETDEIVQQDLDILLKSLDRGFRWEDFWLRRKVPFFNASNAIFNGIRELLDDQVAPGRRPNAVVRLRKYAGTENGFQPYTELLKQRAIEQMAKPDVIYPSKQAIETELGRNANYLDGIAALFEKYHQTGWEPAYATLKAELADYDAWLKANILPRARQDFRLQRDEYALAFEAYGIDVAPADIAGMAHAAFTQYQAEMAPLAAQIARKNGYASSDYRAVIAELKKQQIAGDAVIPFYENRLHEIEAIIRAQKLLTLPDRPAIIRLATAAETAQQPAPYMKAPPLLNNTGQRGVFVLPMNIPGANGAAADTYDDFNFDAAAWTMIAHEARPGHELQFDSMVEQGISLARGLYAFNSTNVEGWGLYAEYMLQPYEPVEGQLLTLQFRLLRAARAYLDPELQSGKITPEQAYDVLEKDVMLSHAFAKEEVERFTYRMPGQANSYFYGYTRLLALRREVEAALGSKFDQQKFHDFILAQGLLTPDLMRRAVLETFVPSHGRQ